MPQVSFISPIPPVGTVTEAMLSLSDNTIADASTTKHGFMKKLPNDATKFYDGTGSFTVISNSVTLIASTLLAADAATIDFDSIATGYKMFIVSAFLITDATSTYHGFRLNNDSNQNYEHEELIAASGTVSSTSSPNSTAVWVANANQASTTNYHFIVIHNSTDAQAKAYDAHGGSVARFQHDSGYYDSQTEISRITFLRGAGNFAAGSRVTVWGVK